MLDHQFVQSVEVISISDNEATLKLSDGQTIYWPKSLLPETIKQGQKLRMIVHDKETEQKERASLARTLLNEVFDTSD